MDSFSLLLLLLLNLQFLGKIVAASSDQEITFDDPDLHKEFLDPQENYFLQWFVEWDSKLVFFDVTVKTTGYIGLGLSKDGKIKGADIVIGGVYPNGSVYFGDYHGTANGIEIDQTQNWIPIEEDCMENETHTVLSFQRDFHTCDDNDISMNNNSRYILWSHGDTDDFSQFPGNNEGAFVTYLLDLELTPWSLKQYNRGTEGSSPELEDGILRWNIKETFHIPEKRTTYWCDVKKFSLPSRHHIIGQNIRINPDARVHVHHMLFLRCTPPKLLNLYFEEFLTEYSGEECYDLASPSGRIPTIFCSDLKAGFAIGQQPFFTPSNVGIPIGDYSTTEYFLFQVHYDNPAILSNITVEMNIDLYYTKNLRDNEVSAFSVGHPFPGSPSILVPLDSKDHGIYGHCSSACTQKMFPSEGVRVIAAFLHSHNARRRMKMQHFRNGTELPYIMNDDNFQFQFQNTRLLREEVVLLPGDQLTMTSYYDTTTASKSVVGGYSTDQEMCVGLVSVYNRVDAYPICRSEINSVDFMQQYLNGTEKLEWNQTILEYQRTKPKSPKRLLRKSVSEISVNFVSWDTDLRADLAMDHLIMEQQTMCPNVKDLVAIALGLIDPPSLEFTSYPVDATPFDRTQQCKSDKGLIVFPEDDLLFM